MDERNIRCFLGESFKRQRDERGSVAALGEQGYFPGLEVGSVEGPLFSAGKDADDATERSGALEEGEEVKDEAGTRVVH